MKRQLVDWLWVPAMIGVVVVIIQIVRHRNT
jgi:hypothetical protein